MSSCLKILLRYPLAARQQPRFKLRLTAIVVAAFLLWHFINSYKNFRYDIPHTDPPASVDKETQLSCDSLQGLGDIFLILRTGASEALRRLPAHFNTTLRCLHSQNYGIWSDYEEYIGGHHVHDAFDEMDPEVIASHPDFAYYRRLKEQGRSSFTVDELTGWATAPNSAGGRDTPGWKLDKWKFLPIADKAYRQQPNAKWYIFMEGDTYIHWANILHWLSHIDASKPYYMGQEMQIGDIVFAYGGSSFIISNSAMKTLVEYRATKPGVYEEFTGNHWAGDCVLGKAMLDAGIKLSWQYPNLFGGMPYDMDYNETFGSPQRRLWCYPTTTYHHVSPSDVEEIYHNEQKWNQEKAKLMRHGDVFRSLVRPKLAERVEDWQSISADDEGTKGTFEECRAACEDKPGCLQYLFHEDAHSCKISNRIRVGSSSIKDKDHSERIVSGWVIDRVDAFVADMDTRCLDFDVDWKLPG
ncbi:hypothetical protein SCUP234_06926 [Seiridium cupressi]